MSDPLHLSLDDLAVAAAKDKLVGLADRPGYRDAMQPRPSGSRKAQLILVVVGLGLFGLAYGACSHVGATWLRLVMTGVFVVLGLLTVFLSLGAWPQPAPQPWPVAVVGKPPDGEVEKHRLTLLRDDGTTITITANEALHAILRPGDVGIAHVRPAMRGPGPPWLMIGFHRM